MVENYQRSEVQNQWVHAMKY